MKYTEKLRKLWACGEAIRWCEEGKFPTLEKAWQSCERGDWMLWLIGKLSSEPTSDNRKRLVLVACECARLALPYVEKGEARPLQAIEMAERWANGDDTVTLEMVRAAANAAAYAAANAAANAAYAAYAAANAAYAAANAKIQKECADIVRKHYPKAPSIKGAE